MADEKTGLNISDITSVAAAATVLITTISALAVSGALQEMERDHGVALITALTCVLVAAVAWAGLTLTKPPAAAVPPVAPGAADPWPYVASFDDDLAEIIRLLPRHPDEARQRLEDLDRDFPDSYAAELHAAEEALRADPPETAWVHERVRAFQRTFPDLCSDAFKTLDEALAHDAVESLDLLHTIRGELPDAVAAARDNATALLTRSAGASWKTNFDGAKEARRQVEKLRAPAAPAAAPGAWGRVWGVCSSRSGLQIAALLLFVVGMVFGLVGMIRTQGEQERPAVAATFDAKNQLLTGSATVHNVGTNERLLTQIVAVANRGKGPQKEVVWYAASGPDASGTVRQEFSYHEDDPSFQALVVSASRSANLKCVDLASGRSGLPQPYEDIGATIVQHTLPGCVVIALPPQTAATSEPPKYLKTALEQLGALAVAPAASMNGYSRQKFGAPWADVDHNHCDTRNDILRRDLRQIVLKSGSNCVVARGVLHDPYTSEVINFVRGPHSAAVQIDHVVALGDAWRTGAAEWSPTRRLAYANARLVLLAVDGPANEAKGDDDASQWLPPNAKFQCRYVARQISIKRHYHLWVTAAEKTAMTETLAGCSGTATK